MLESHPQDCRVGLAKDNIAQTLTEAMGTGGGNVPLVMVTPKTMKIRCEIGRASCRERVWSRV